ncbi:MAG TPA: tRNA epoxyqueuosine(34) reductase QueG [Bacteroidota bacterium]|nr:tRNA epoxyqueuosine(34) reductase QueG [Bacteroidota bacterium]
MSALTKEIKDRALELGFSRVGIARAERLEADSARLSDWLENGYHGTMRWMAQNFEKRVDPGCVVPGARSVVAVAMNYHTPNPHSDDPETGKVSRYAWGDDYHGVLESRLKQLLAFVQGRDPHAAGKIYVDTGPVMEKLWAQRAGIGWEGKHTNVITEEYGSWVFLGEMILDIELDYDEPAVDRCGTCTLCIEACPTQAIVEPYVLDSNRCISYLTIEHRGPIAPELGEQFDRWVYGCDICQDVCPWNTKFSKPTDLQEFAPRGQNIAPRLTDLASLSKEEFTARYRKSAMKRAKREGITRNATVAMTSKPAND